MLRQTETPGLGTKMADEGNVLLASIQGKNLEQMKLVDGKLAVRKDGGDVDALTAEMCIRDSYKSEMYDLARYINRVHGNVIPESILDKEPSSELRPDQKDSDLLPPYEVVDAILYRMIEEGQHREEIVNAGFDSHVVAKIHAMIMRNEKKRHQFPPVLRLSACAFGHERLMPLTNRYGCLLYTSVLSREGGGPGSHQPAGAHLDHGVRRFFERQTLARGFPSGARLVAHWPRAHGFLGRRREMCIRDRF